jgi:hypothetical protein
MTNKLFTQEDIQIVKTEIRADIERMLAEGKKSTEVREGVQEAMQNTHHHSMMQQISQLIDPNASLEFIYRFNLSLGIVNEVLFYEYEITPLHLREFESPVVNALEKTSEQDIFELFKQVDMLLADQNENQGGLN